MRSSPVIRNSPLTVNTSFDRRATSPRNFSPSPRLASESPVRNYYSSAVTHTPLNSSLLSATTSNSKLNTETYRVTQHSYKSSINQSASPVPRITMKSPTHEGVDYSSNISSLKKGASRRDSWDVINKTKNMFSNNSLESLANLTEKQLDTKYDRSAIDTETHSNTQYNKFALHDSSVKERSEKYVSKTSSNDYGYSTSKFLPIDDGVEGARAIRVSNKPDGYLGQPFEFESESRNWMNE